MSAQFKVHTITLSPDNDHTECEFRVILPDGRQLGLFSRGSLTVYVPHHNGEDGEPFKPSHGFERVEIDLPRTMDDVADRCDRADNGRNFTVTARHRH